LLLFSFFGFTTVRKITYNNIQYFRFLAKIPLHRKAVNAAKRASGRRIL